MSRKLFVGSLPWSTTDAELREAFEEWGTVLKANVVNDRDTGKSRGFGFVEFENAEDAEVAIKKMNGAELGGRKIAVNEAQAKSRDSGPRRERSR